MTLAPTATARRACSRLCTWQISGIPAARIAGACGAGSMRERNMAAGRKPIVFSRSYGCYAMDQVMKPQPTAPVVTRSN